MGDSGGIGELIRAAAEGATGGVAVLRAGGIPASLGNFAVEIDYSTCPPHGPEVGAVVRLDIVCGEAPAQRRRLTAQAARSQAPAAQAPRTR